MKKFMHILAMVLSVVMILSITSACSSSNSSSGDNKSVTLRFMWWGGDARHNNTLAIIDLYKKAKTNVTIEAEYGGWDGYQDKLTTQLAGGTAPDIMQISYSWVSDLQNKGKFFVNLSKYPKLIDLDMFSSDLLNSYCKVDKAVVAVPAGSSGLAFLINKNTLSKAGVDLNQKWTWDSYLDAAKAVHTLGSDYYLTVCGKESLYEKYLRPYVIGLTGKAWIKDDYTMGFTRDNLVQAFNYIKALNDNNAWPPVSEVASAATLGEDPRWIDGKIACTLDEWVSSFYPTAQAIGDAADVLVRPMHPDKKDTAIAIPPSQLFAVSSKSANIDAAIKFVNYMFTDEEALTTLSDCRGVPSSKKGLEVAEAKKLVNPLVTKSLKLALDNSTKVPFNSMNDDSELNAAGQDVAEKLVFGQLTPEAAADDLISRFNVRLAEMKAEK